MVLTCVIDSLISLIQWQVCSTCPVLINECQGKGYKFSYSKASTIIQQLNQHLVRLGMIVQQFGQHCEICGLVGINFSISAVTNHLLMVTIGICVIRTLCQAHLYRNYSIKEIDKHHMLEPAWHCSNCNYLLISATIC